MSLKVCQEDYCMNDVHGTGVWCRAHCKCRCKEITQLQARVKELEEEEGAAYTELLAQNVRLAKVSVDKSALIDLCEKAFKDIVKENNMTSALYHSTFTLPIIRKMKEAG